ncbi:MAG: hypothetical protein WCF25_02040 [Acidimicrobiales bacterium]
MKHATAATLNEMAPLLVRLRAFDELVEKTPGSFYRKSKAFLHFHEDPLGVFVDVRLAPGASFTRLRVTTQRERAALIAEVKQALAH